MFARKITNLALVWLLGVTGRNFSGTIRIQVRPSGGAVQARDRELVDVVHCGSIVSLRSVEFETALRWILTERTTNFRQSRNGDLHIGTSAI
jgi:hypothetical protein